MVVDFHTHTFPDKIAAQSIAYLSEKGGIRACTAGTLTALKNSMRENGVDVSVVLPIATKPKQEAAINALSKAENGKDGVYFAGGIHPDCPDVEGTLDFIKDAGLFGIKLHPDYQGVHFDDPRCLFIMEQAARRGLYIVTHAGVDIAFRDHVHCTPDMILHVLSELGGVIEDKLVLAHLGGFELPDEVLQKLCGKPVYLDTAAVLGMYPDKCRQIIAKHGPEKVLFATDSPWAPQGAFKELLHSFGFSEEEEALMFYKNAMRLLGVQSL